MLDIAIPVAPKDYPKLERCLRGLLRNARTPIGRIFLIAADDAPLAALDESLTQRVSIVSESEFPFSKRDIEKILEQHGASRRQASWYYQQLLKFYVFDAIHELRGDVLIVDADFTICRALHFLTDDGRAILSRGYPFKWLLSTRDYPSQIDHIHADFARRLVPGWAPVDPFSGMHHHMVFLRDIVAGLFAAVEQAHGLPFWRAFTQCVRLEKWNAASEYVLYYHFARSRYAERVVVRDLQTCDILHDADDSAAMLDEFDRRIASGGYDAVGCHAFLDLRARLRTMDYIPGALKAELAQSCVSSLLLHLHDSVLQIRSLSEA